MRPAARQDRSTARSAALALLLLLVGCTSSPHPRSIGPSSAPASSPALPAPLSASGSRHVVVIVMENKEYSSIVGSAQAPYLGVLAGRYALATRYFANEHPSLPNYLDLIGGSDFGIHDDGESYLLQGSSLVDQLEAGGLTWRAYMEGMPEDATAPCPFASGGSRYRKKHNPFAYFAQIQSRSARCQNVVPYSLFASDLAAGLPNFSWITPDMCNDMHDCGVATGDVWLARNVPPILSHLSGRDLLFVVFDEGSTSLNGGGHVVCVVAGPGARAGTTSALPYNHYSLLRTVEDVLGLGHLRHAGDSGVVPMNALLR